jgi:hypothetical protein
MRISIKALDGMILTNGEIYGTEIFLADGVSSSDFYQITLEEYNEIMKKEAEESERM